MALFKDGDRKFKKKKKKKKKKSGKSNDQEILPLLYLNLSAFG